MGEFAETLFLGGGLSCLTAARLSKGDWLLLERDDRVGGLCKSDEVEGFTFDRTGHLLHLSRPRTRVFLEKLLQGRCERVRRDAWIHSHGTFTRYPFQAHFYGLPPEVAADCLLGLFEAERRRPRARRIPAGFHRFALEQFGRGVAEHFLFPYNRKLWTVSPARLTTEWMGRFVPRPSLREVVLGALSDRPGEEGYNPHFLYPRTGGIETLVRALAPKGPRVRSGVEVVGVDLEHRQVQTSAGERIGFGVLVSSIPLPALIRMIRPLPDAVRRAARRLKASAVWNLNLGVRDRGDRRHWIYVPEDRFALYRYGFASNFSGACAPPGMAAIYTEVAYPAGSPIDRVALRKRILGELQELGAIRSRRDVVVERSFDLDPAYAIYDRGRTPAVKLLRRYLEQRSVYPIGRYGRWEYGSMEDAVAEGIEIVERLSGRSIALD